MLAIGLAAGIFKPLIAGTVRAVTDISVPGGLGTDGNVLLAVGNDIDLDPPSEPIVSGASIWMSADAVEWVQVPPAALDGDAILDSVGASAALPFDGRWVVLGETWTTSEGSDVGVVWQSIV